MSLYPSSGAMRVTSLEDTVRRPRKLAVGEFDGVHLGHRLVIDGSDTVLTFEPHPAVVVHPDRAPKLLTSLEVKIDLIAALGVQELVVVQFDERFAALTADQFIDRVLVDQLAATDVAVGENFRFGHDATGSSALLAADPRFRTRVVELVWADGRPVSSTTIRKLVAEGDVAHAGELLGAPFRLQGTVVPGDRRGRELGFPTANIVPDARLVCPAFGVYACMVGKQLAAVNVGVRPTFGDGKAVLVEAFLLDFQGDLYGQDLTVEFIERLRGEERFASAEELITQMHDDVERVRELLACQDA